MSIEAIRWALRVPVAEPEERLILLVLADSADSAGNVPPLVTTTLTAVTCLSDRQIRRTITILEKKDLVYRMTRYRDDGGQDVNSYALRIADNPIGGDQQPVVAAPPTAKPRKNGGADTSMLAMREGTHAFGQFQNVWLTAAELEELMKLHGQDAVLAKIEDLSLHIKGVLKKDVTYIDHYAVLCSWMKRPGIRPPPGQATATMTSKGVMKYVPKN